MAGLSSVSGPHQHRRLSSFCRPFVSFENTFIVPSGTAGIVRPLDWLRRVFTGYKQVLTRVAFRSDNDRMISYPNETVLALFGTNHHALVTANIFYRSCIVRP